MAPTGNSDYARIQRVLEHIVAGFPSHPSLADLAAEVGLSEHHFQRMFTRWAGVSPKKFMQHLSLEAAKARLRESASVLDAAYEAGLSGPGRLHDLFVAVEALTPGEYKRGGEGMVIRYGYCDTPFGDCLLMSTDRGVCGLAFVGTAGRKAALYRLAKGWGRAALIRDDRNVESLGGRVFRGPAGPWSRDAGPLRLLLKGTPFQLKVWQALLTMPPGTLTTYGDLARRIGLPPGAARAVGAANGANAISWLIPCHRVIRETGALGGYRWGEARKLAMIGWEAAVAGAPAHSRSGHGAIPPHAMNGGFSNSVLP